MCIVCGVALGAWPLAAQAARSRSADYLSIAGVDDARAIWVNPAGLAADLAASIFAELVIEQESTDHFRLGQWSFGFNAQGLAFAYQRDRFLDESTEAFRLASAIPFPRGAIGGSLTLYRGGVQGSETGGEVGVTYRPAAPLRLGGVVRNLGRPVTRLAPDPLEGVLGIAWSPLPRQLALSGDIVIREHDAVGQGGGLAFQGGLYLSTGGRVPITLLGAVAGDDTPALRRFVVGLALGGEDRALAVGSWTDRSSGDWGIGRLSLAGLAVRGGERRYP